MKMDAMREFMGKHAGIIIAITATFAASCILYIFGGTRFPNDDQFILYRYIDNIAFGQGFVFNPGEKILGSTTPLFTLLAALVKYAIPRIPTPDLVDFINIALISASAFFFFRIASRLMSGKLAAVATGIYALNMAKVVPEGMETPLFVVLILAFIDRLVSERHYAASILLSLAILTRPDAGLIALLAAVYWWKKTGIVKTVKLAATSFVVALPWLVFSTAYFGSPIPQSLLAKLHTNDIVNQAPYQALKVQLAHLSRLYWGKVIDPDNLPFQIIINLFPILALIFIGIKKKLDRNNWIIFAIPLAYLISFSISNPVMFPWYLSQVEPLWILASFAGIAIVLDRIGKKGVTAAAIILLTAGPLMWWVTSVATDSPGTKTALFDSARYIRDNMNPGDTIGISNIGIVGYITDGRIIDFFGLVTPGSVAYYPINDPCLDKNTQYVIPPKLIEDTAPDWIVAGDKELISCFRNGEWFSSSYSLAYRSGGANVWSRND